MSDSHEPHDLGQQPADPAAPTQFTPVGGQAPQADSGQQPAPAPAPAPAFGGQPAADAPVWGQAAPQQPTMPYAYPGAQVSQAAARGSRATLLLRSGIGRLVIFLLIAGGVAIYHFATLHPAQRASTGQVSQAGALQASDLQVGDCFDNPTADSNISSITAIPCTQPHDSQVFDEPPITESTYPGESTLSTEAAERCGDPTPQSSIMQSAPADLKISALYPEDAATFNSGTDYITCFIVSDSKDLTASYVSTP